MTIPQRIVPLDPAQFSRQMTVTEAQRKLRAIGFRLVATRAGLGAVRLH